MIVYAEMCVPLREMLQITNNFHVLYKISLELERINGFWGDVNYIKRSVDSILAAVLKGVLEVPKCMYIGDDFPSDLIRRIAVRAIVSFVPN